METLNVYPKYYNLAGRFTESKKEFKKYLKTELTFYKKLHEQAVEKGAYGIKINPGKTNKIFRLSDF